MYISFDIPLLDFYNPMYKQFLYNSKCVNFLCDNSILSIIKTICFVTKGQTIYSECIQVIRKVYGVFFDNTAFVVNWKFWIP